MTRQSAIILTPAIAVMFIPATQVSASGPTMSFTVTGLHRVRFTKWSGHAATQAATHSAVVTTVVPSEDRMVGGCHQGTSDPRLETRPCVQKDLLDTPRFQWFCAMAVPGFSLFGCLQGLKSSKGGVFTRWNKGEARWSHDRRSSTDRPRYKKVASLGDTILAEMKEFLPEFNKLMIDMNRYDRVGPNRAVYSWHLVTAIL